MATLQIDQTGLPAGVAGESRTDGLGTGATVTLTSTESGISHEFTLLWVPEDDATAVSSFSAGGTTATFTPDSSSVGGTYRIRLRVTTSSGTTETIRLFSIRTAAGLRIPALNERADESASLENDGADVIDASEMNEPAASGPFASGNYGGWYTAFSDLVQYTGDHKAQHIDGGLDPIDGDKLEITWTGHANYTPTTSPSEVDATDQLTAHLAGIDAAIASAGTLVVDSGVTPSGNVYDSLSSALTVANAADGLVVIELLTDVTESSSGALDFSNVRLEGRRKTDGTRPTLTIQGSTTIVGSPMLRFVGVSVDFDTVTTPVLDINGVSQKVVWSLYDCVVTNSSGTDVIQVTGAGTSLTLLCAEGTHFPLATDLISLLNNAECFVYAFDYAVYDSSGSLTDIILETDIFATGDATGAAKIFSASSQIVFNKSPAFLGTVELIQKGGMKVLDIATGTTTLDTLSDRTLYILADTSGGPITIDLPAIDTDFSPADQVIIIKDSTGNAAANNITINDGGAVAGIDGSTSVVLDDDEASISLMSSATANEWKVISRYSLAAAAGSTPFPDLHDTTPSPFALYQFQDNLIDSSGTGKAALTVLSGTERYTELVPGLKGFYFDGSTVLENVTDSSFQITGDITLMGLFSSPFTFNTEPIVCTGSVAGETTADNYLYGLVVNGSSSLEYFAESGGGVNITHAFEDRPTQNVICHVALVRSSNDVTLYINGEVARSSSSGLTAPDGGSNSTFRLGEAGFEGSMSSIAVYNSALSATQIKDAYNETLGVTYGTKA